MKKKILFYILDFIILILSYMLCDYVVDRLNLIVGLIVGFSFYGIIYYILYKLFKIDNIKK